MHASQIGPYMRSMTAPVTEVEKESMATCCATARASVWCAEGSMAASQVTSSRFNPIRQVSDSCTWQSNEGRECVRQSFLLASVNVE